MKKWIVTVMTASIMLCASVAVAEDSPVKVSLGLKSWYNAWTHNVDYADGTTHSWNNGSAFMLGPSLNIKAGGVFLGASYLKSLSDYKANDWNTAGDSMAFERKDLDATVGYMFSPYFGAFLGYKTIDAPMTYTTKTGGTDPTENGIWKLKGPGIGILANAPLGRSAALYGNLSVLKVKQEFEYAAATSSSFDMTGASFEIGAAFAFTRSLSSNIGFKYQSFWGDSTAGNTHYQNFYGLTLGLTYTI